MEWLEANGNIEKLRTEVREKFISGKPWLKGEGGKGTLYSTKGRKIAVAGPRDGTKRVCRVHFPFLNPSKTR